METVIKEKLYFKDKHFCSYWETCSKGCDCKNALTEQVVKEAYHFRLPILQFETEPKHCFSLKSDTF